MKTEKVSWHFDKLKYMKNRYHPNYTVSPGEVLVDHMESQKISIINLSNQAGISIKTIKKIIAGNQEITPEVAAKFGRIFKGISSSLWLGLEKNYQYDKRMMSKYK